MTTMLVAALALTQTPTTAPKAPAVLPSYNPVETLENRQPKLKTGGNVLIKNGQLLTVSHGSFIGDLLIQGGKIAKIGSNLAAPTGVAVIDAKGRFVSPGLVDAHSHRASDSSVNEGATSISAETEMRETLNADGLGVWNALASGITSELLLHGSANPIGGQSVVIKNRWRALPDDMIFKGAPEMIKFALGENPKGSNDFGNHTPRFAESRSGIEAVYRRAFHDAKAYAAEWDAWNKTTHAATDVPPRKDVRLEALAGILSGRIWVQCHSYRQDEILMMARLSQEFGFHLNFQHALEAYKVAPELAKAGIGASCFGDGFTYKIEVVDSFAGATSILHKAGVLTSINTDTSGGTVPLTQDAGKAVRFGTSPDDAFKMITLNPAIQLGIDKWVGTLDEGKDGDIAIWDGYPLSVYSKCAMTLVDGEVAFERHDLLKVDKNSTYSNSIPANGYEPEKWSTLKPAKSYLITGATVHLANGSVLSATDVLLGDGRVVAVGTNLKVPSGTVQLNAKGHHVYPGLIDAGTVVGLKENEAVPSMIDTDETGDYRPDLRAGVAVNPESVHIPIVRANGVTTAYVRLGSGLVAGQGSVIDLAGYTTEDLAVSPTAALDVYVPEPPPAEFAQFMPPDAFAQQVAGVAGRTQVIRDALAAGKRYAEAPLSADVKLAALVPYVQGKRPVIFHVNGEAGIRKALEIAKEFGIRPIIAGGSDAWKLVDKLREAKAAVILTAPSISCPSSVSASSENDPYDAPYANAGILDRAGIPIAFESGSADDAKNLPYAVGRLCAFGLSSKSALRALTSGAAEILGLSKSVGDISTGLIGNVIVTDGDPLEVSTHVKALFIGGKAVPVTSHYTDLWSKYNARLKK